MNFTKYRKSCSELLKDLVFPRRCPVCDQPVSPPGALICKECEELLKKKALVGDMTCCKCGRPLHPEKGDGYEYCKSCQKTKHCFTFGTSVYRYRVISGALYRMKYDGRAEYADFFGHKMAQKMLRDRRFQRADLLIPVPTSLSRVRSRGYDHAVLMARVISKETGIPLAEKALERDLNTPVLRSRSAAERRAFLKNAFIAHRNDVKLRIIVLVDDIYTTGATMDACTDALLKAGAKEVYCITLAIGETY